MHIDYTDSNRTVYLYNKNINHKLTLNNTKHTYREIPNFWNVKCGYSLTRMWQRLFKPRGMCPIVFPWFVKPMPINNFYLCDLTDENHTLASKFFLKKSSKVNYADPQLTKWWKLCVLEGFQRKVVENVKTYRFVLLHQLGSATGIEIRFFSRK